MLTQREGLLLADVKNPCGAACIHSGRFAEVFTASRRLCESWQQFNDIIPVDSPKIVVSKPAGLIESPDNFRSRIPGRGPAPNTICNASELF